MPHEVTRGGIITSSGRTEPCLCRRRDEGPAWIAAAVSHAACRDPAVATILVTDHQPDSCRLTVREDIDCEPLRCADTAWDLPLRDPGHPHYDRVLGGLEPDAPTRIAVAFSSGELVSIDTPARAAGAALDTLLRQRELTAPGDTEPPRPVLIAHLVDGRPAWMASEPSVPTTPLANR
ncbi:MAG: hypothetical protein OXI15_02305 [Chromatiales bacterium]|nr:hypothetical protein [Chromatiales bacterium]